MGPFDDLTESQRMQIREAYAAAKERAMRAPQEKPRGVCPDCDRSISLTVAGRIRTHGREKDVGQRFMNCRGSGQKPKEG
jgi:RNase P subunit RPR2